MRPLTRLVLGLAAAVAVVLVASAVRPYDRTTWWLEVFPILLAAPLLAATYRRFPLTPLLYVLIALHATILAVGGHYTYARVPLGFWIQDLFGLARNHYDRLGHLAQGFVPAIAAREILIRLDVVRRRGWRFFLVLTICLAISVFYEFIEWWTALVAGGGATEFLGTQGDPWDTQWDMFLAGLGAIAAQLALGRAHDRQLARLASGGPRPSEDQDRGLGAARRCRDPLLARRPAAGGRRPRADRLVARADPDADRDRALHDRDPPRHGAAAAARRL